MKLCELMTYFNKKRFLHFSFLCSDVFVNESSFVSLNALALANENAIIIMQHDMLHIFRLVFLTGVLC